MKNITVDKENQSNRSNTGISAGNDDGVTVLITAEDVYAGGADETEVVGISSTVDNGSTNIITVDNVTSTGTGIKVTEVDGYTFKSMSTSNAEAILAANSDGTYTLTMPRGGNVSLDLVYEVIRKQEEQKETQEEKRATITGSDGNAVTGGQWNMGPGGIWTYRNNGIFKDTWGYITLANGKTGWFWFDKNGVMATGWNLINNTWYYFNKEADGTQGMMFLNATTPDGYKVGADGALIQ